MEDSGSVPQQHVFTHPSPVEHWRHLVEIVALLIAAIWGFYVFVYQERIKPSAEQPVLEVLPVIAHEPMGAGKELVLVSVDTKNISDTPARIQYIAANVYGVKFARTPAPSRHAQNDSLPITDRRLVLTYALTGPVFGGTAGSIYQPGRQKPNRRFFAVRQGEFDAVSIEWLVCYARDDFKDSLPYRFGNGRDGSTQTSLSRTAARELASRGVICAFSPLETNAEAL